MDPKTTPRASSGAELKEILKSYDFKGSEEDNSTVKLVYENRGEKLGIARLDLNDRIAENSEEAGLDADQEATLEKLLGRDYEVITAPDRLNKLAIDFVDHCVARWQCGKSMLVCIDKVTFGRMWKRVKRLWKRKQALLAADIARAKRVYPGKDCGVIVDYNGMLKILREALAQYASDVLKEIYKIVNEAIRAQEPGDDQMDAKFFDLSQIDFAKLRDEFAKKVRRKAATLQDIRGLLAALNAHLRSMPNWTKNTHTQADVEIFILDNLYASLPHPPFSDEETDFLAARIYDFVWQRCDADAMFAGAT
ncbi:MAG TPA: hypothetical protein P5186_02890 [Candidatus Paceibacterota bacterium]|nr:hypothetical protein [Verrucomicrobiota bacterium]HRY46971.1 hypothetical protein [Candidatus Paceibacterota bacterium]